MKTFEENMVIWNQILGETTHPLHKSILSNFHSDMTQDIVYHIEVGRVEKDFNSIMNCVLKYLLMHLHVQIKASKEFELLEKALGDEISDKIDELFKDNDIDIYYLINDFLPEEEFKIQWEKDGCGKDDTVYASMSINAKFTDEQLAMMELTNVKYKFGRLVELYLNVSGTYINGKDFEEFED